MKIIFNVLEEHRDEKHVPKNDNKTKTSKLFSKHSKVPQDV